MSRETHRVNLHWLFERISFDPTIYVHFDNTGEQMSDVLTKGSFKDVQWHSLMQFMHIKSHRSHSQLTNKTQRKDKALFSVPAEDMSNYSKFTSKSSVPSDQQNFSQASDCEDSGQDHSDGNLKQHRRLSGSKSQTTSVAVSDSNTQKKSKQQN